MRRLVSGPNYQPTQTNQLNHMKDLQEPVKKYGWTIRVRRQNQEVDDLCQYKATHGPVTAEHVRQSPSVKEWIAGDRLVSISPANEKSPDAGATE